VVVGALVVVNAYEEVIDPAGGEILAGARRPLAGRGGRGFVAISEYLLRERGAGVRRRRVPAEGNTTLAVVATNGTLDKVGAGIVAQRAHDGFARTIRPAHTMFDGDTVFCLAVGGRRADVDRVAIAAVAAVEMATVRAVVSSRRSSRARVGW